MATLIDQLGYPNVSLSYMDSILNPGSYETVAWGVGIAVGDQVLVWTLVTDLSDYYPGWYGTDPITDPVLSSCTLVDSNTANSRLKWYVFEVTSTPPDDWLEMTMDGIGANALPGAVYWQAYTGLAGSDILVDDFHLRAAEIGTGSGPWSAPQSASVLTASDFYGGFAVMYSVPEADYEFTSAPSQWTCAAPTGRTKVFTESDGWFDWQNKGSMGMQAYVPYAAGAEETDPWVFTGSLNTAATVAYWTVEFSFSFTAPPPAPSTPRYQPITKKVKLSPLPYEISSKMLPGVLRSQ